METMEQQIQKMRKVVNTIRILTVVDIGLAVLIIVLHVIGVL